MCPMNVDIVGCITIRVSSGVLKIPAVYRALRETEYQRVRPRAWTWNLVET